jgi:hypothetical protein
MGIIIAHRRKKLYPARGSQYYRDYSLRGRGTVCGAECGWFDLTASVKKHPSDWVNGNGDTVHYCEECWAKSAE